MKPGVHFSWQERMQNTLLLFSLLGHNLSCQQVCSPLSLSSSLLLNSIKNFNNKNDIDDNNNGDDIIILCREDCSSFIEYHHDYYCGKAFDITVENDNDNNNYSLVRRKLVLSVY